MPQDIKARLREQLRKRTQEAYNRKDGGNRFKDYFSIAKMEGINKVKFSKGEHLFDIIPYEAGEHDPNCPAGEFTYGMDVWVHMGIGASEEQVLCLAQYKQPCPICEEVKIRREQGLDYDADIKPLIAKRRNVFNVIIRKNKEEEAKGVQLLEISYHFLGKHLASISKDPYGDGEVTFSDPVDGKTIAMERTGVGAKDTGYSGHRLVDRRKEVSNKELEQALCLDSLVELKTYKEVKELLFSGKSAPTDDDEDAPVKSSKNKICKATKKKIGEYWDEYDVCDTCDFNIECKAICNGSSMGDDVPY